MDYYEILGVSRSATDAEIKRAYRRLSFAYHPDKNPDPDVENLYKQINEAYDVLSDPEKRRAYDFRGVFQFDVEPPQQPQPRRHRDPRYRPRPTKTRSANDKYTVREVMEVSMKYLTWVNRVGFLVTTLFIADYFIPYKQVTEKVNDVEQYDRSARGNNGNLYFEVTTEEGTYFKMNGEDVDVLLASSDLDLKISRIYGTVMTVRNANTGRWVETRSMYGGVAMFPIGLFISSFTALIFQKKRLSLSFNLSMVSCMFLLITLLLIFML